MIRSAVFWPTLDALGMTENTIIVFTSDHGDYMGEHRLMLKGIPAFEGAYRVPLICHGPGVPAGRQVDEIVSLLDLVPTLATADAWRGICLPRPFAAAVAGRASRRLAVRSLRRMSRPALQLHPAHPLAGQ